MEDERRKFGPSQNEEPERQLAGVRSVVQICKWHVYVILFPMNCTLEKKSKPIGP
jgi:hypothetical protein